MRLKSRTMWRGRRKLTPARRAWARRITAALSNTVAAFIEVGRLVNEAKDELPHGEFIKMLEHDLRISPDKAEKLMAIARHPVLSNSAHVRFLPATYSTLYEMSRFPAATLLAKIESREIHPDLQRSDVLVWGAEEIRHRFIESRKTVHEVDAPRVVTVEIKDATIEKRAVAYVAPPRLAPPPARQLETSIHRLDLVAAWKTASSGDQNHFLRSTLVERDGESGWRLKSEIIHMLRRADNIIDLLRRAHN